MPCRDASSPSRVKRWRVSPLSEFMARMSPARVPMYRVSSSVTPPDHASGVAICPAQAMSASSSGSATMSVNFWIIIYFCLGSTLLGQCISLNYTGVDDAVESSN